MKYLIFFLIVTNVSFADNSQADMDLNNQDISEISNNSEHPGEPQKEPYGKKVNPEKVFKKTQYFVLVGLVVVLLVLQLTGNLHGGNF